MKNFTFKTTFILILVVACSSPISNSDSSTQSNLVERFIEKILPPIASVQPLSIDFTFDNAVGEVFTTERGSVVMIPENTFVDKNGLPIKGNVTVSYKELFKLSEVFLAGIPMNVMNKNGETQPFISDGMFEINAKANSQELSIGASKNISVALPSHKTNQDFDYWFFNQSSNEWENIGDRDSTLSVENVLECAKNSNPVMAQKNEETILNIANVNDVNQEGNQVNVKPEMNSSALTKPVAISEYKNSDFVFNLQADYQQYEELKSFKNVLWKPLLKMDELNQGQLKADIQKVGANVKIEEIDKELMVYNLICAENTYKVTPVLMGSDLKKSRENYKKSLNKYKVALAEEQKKIDAIKLHTNQKNQLFNYFSVKKLGVYNCDRFYSTIGSKSKMNFTANSTNIYSNLYVLLNNQEGVVNLSEAYLKNGSFELPTGSCKAVFHIAKDGTFYKKAFSKEDSKKSEIELNMEPNDFVVASVQDMDKLIDEL